ncbi:MAG: hypothetical protein RLZZ126_1581 [Pseudomonadota bacterium]|jgi:hypothetical protein
MIPRSSAIRWVGVWALLGVLAACGEKPQTLGAPKQDAAASTGSTVSAYHTGTWKPGDKTAWEQQIRTRTQNGQNEYTRAP